MADPRLRGYSNLANQDSQETQVRPQKQQKKGSAFAGMIQQGYGDELIRDIISPQTRVEHVVYRLAGKQYNKDTKEWEVDEENRVFNEKCEKFLIGVLNAQVSTDTIMTRVDDKEDINYIAERFVAQLIIDLMLEGGEISLEKGGKYGIESPTQIAIIVEVLGNVVWLNLRRAFMQGERKMIGQSYEQKVTQQVQPQQNKRGFWQGLLGKK